MGKCILKAELPLFSTYHYQMFPGVVLGAHPDGNNWYYNECIMLQCGKRFLQGYTSPDLNVCRTEPEFVRAVELVGYNLRFGRKHMHDLIKEILETGYYVVFTYFDDYYIQGKSWYGQRHEIHDGLIYGYDDDAGTYKIMAYDTKWICRGFDTPQSCLEQGAYLKPDNNIDSLIVAVRAWPRPIPLDPAKIKNGLREYLDLTIQKVSPEKEGLVFGIAVNDYVCKYLELLAQGAIPYKKKDRRVFRLLWEFRRCMYQRLTVLDDLLHSDMGPNYQSIAEESNRMRLIYAKYVMRQDNDLLLWLKNQLSELQKKEAEQLEQAILLLGKEGY